MIWSYPILNKVADIPAEILENTKKNEVQNGEDLSLIN